MSDVEISVNGGLPRPGAIEVENDGGLYQWEGRVDGYHGLGEVAMISFSTAESFYAGKALLKSFTLPEGGNDGITAFVGGGPLNVFPIRRPPSEAELAERLQAVRTARKSA